jgi:hypothetical protein
MASPTSFARETLQPTGTPFQNIGLAFSGGGFRAASFCLGTLSYLNEVSWEEGTLLRQVKYISSASGGTITNATYALSVAYGKSFGEFYRHLFGQLEGLALLTSVFNILNDDSVWEQEAYKHKRRNLINAFSIAYDQLLFSWPGETPSARFEALMQAKAGGHLEEVCFNTTEFYRGVLFRQAVKLKPDTESPEEFLYGNYILNLRNGIERRIRLADALAASSCFPAGFEPIVFPSDFINDDLSRDELLSNMRIQPQEMKWEELNDLCADEDLQAMLKALGKPIKIPDLRAGVLGLEDADKLRKNFETGLMDGGVDDNQGIDSLMRANKRREEGTTGFAPFDLMMTNDVGSHYMDPYTPAERKEHSGYMALSLHTVRIISLLLACAGIVLIVAALRFLADRWGIGLAVLGAALALVFGAVFGGLQYLRHFIKGKLRSGGGLNLESNFSPEIAAKFFDFFGGTPIGVLKDMLSERITSILTLNNDVFLKRIRQILYERILDEGRGCFRMKTNHVYDLAYSNDVNRLQNDAGDPELEPTPAMQIVAQCAFEMGTTLWFSTLNKEAKDFNQAALIATGQFTTCYNLLLYIYRMKEPRKAKGGTEIPSYFDELDPGTQERIDKLQGQMRQHYAAFRQDPFWLYNESGKRSNIAGFEPVSMASYKFPDELFKGLRD